VLCSVGAGECTVVWRMSVGSSLTDWCVGVLLGVMNRVEKYILWAAVGWKLGAGRLDKCRTKAIARLVLSCVGWRRMVFEIASLASLGIVPKLACLLGGGPGCRIVHRK